MMWNILQVIADGIIVGTVYAGVAVGFNLIWRSGRVFNIALGEMFMVATFMIVTAIEYGVPVWGAVGVAAAGMVILGILIQWLGLRPLVGESSFILLMATLAMLLILKGLGILLFGPEPQLFPELLGAAHIRLGEVLVSQGDVIGTVLITATVLGLGAFFRYTSRGQLMTAVAEDHQIARSLGIDINRSMALSWVLAGIALVVAVVSFMGGRNVTPQVADLAFVALPVVLLAGLESISGLLVAGIIVGLGQASAGRWLDPYLEGGASLLFPYLMMLVVLLVFPHGLFGWREIERI